MRKDKLSKQNVILYFLGIIPVVWLGLLIAPCLEDGLIGLVQQFGTIMQNPFKIELCEDSVKAVLVLLLAYGIAIGVYLSSEHNYRRREEHGSAKWGTAGSVNKKYANKDKTENKILTQNVAIGLDGRKHRRNLNVLVCGGSGAGKTRFFAKPNIMNANTSFVVLDPKGELLRDTGHLLKEHGYDIKVLDLINMEKSHCYNPFVYLQSDDDIQRLTTNLFKNTTPKGSQTQDPFWDQTAAMLLKALVCYLHYEAPPDEQNFPMVMEMIRAGDVKENNEDYLSVLDELFERLEAKNPEHIALKYYRAYHSGSAKTLKSIQISLVSRLEKFNLDSLAGITQTDEMDLGEIGERKTAVFAVIPDNDSSFNFIVGMLYTQLFQQLYYQADSVHGGSYRSMFISSWTNLPMSLCLMSSTNCCLPCVRGRFQFQSSFRIWHSLKPCLRSNGSPSSATATSFSTSAVMSSPPMSMSQSCLARRPSTRTLTVDLAGEMEATQQTTSSQGVSL